MVITQHTQLIVQLMLDVGARTLSCLFFWLPLEEAEQWDFVASAKNVDEGCFTQRDGKRKEGN